MSGWVRYLELTAKSKTGLSSNVVILALVAAVCAAVTFGLIIFAAFIWLAERYSPLTAALVLCGFFLLVTIAAGVLCLMSQRRTVVSAKLALAARSNQPWLDPKYMLLGMQVGRALGWRKIVPLAAVGFLAAGLAREWFVHEKTQGEEPAE